MLTRFCRRGNLQEDKTMCCDERFITIYKGDDSAAFGVRKIRIYLDSALPAEADHACFRFYSLSREFSAEDIASNNMIVEFTQEETAMLPLGRAFASFRMFDAEGRLFTVSTRIPFLVKSGGAPAEFSNRGIVVDSEMAVIRIAVDIDYALLANLPKINGVEVVGDKSGRDYALNKIPKYSAQQTYKVGEQCLYDKSFYECISPITQPEAWNSEHWEGIGLSGNDKNAVHYTADSGKTDVEKEAARQNIGAASVASVSELGRQVTEGLDKRVKIEGLKAAIADPKDVKLAAASIKEYLQTIYDAIQAL